jgi:hypothetical protein
LRNFLIFILTTVLLLLFGACCSIPITAKDQTVHHLIIGIGIVSTPKQENSNGVFATRTHAIGVHISDQPGLKFAVGYSDSSVVAVPETTENIIVEVTRPLLGPLTIEVNPTHKGDINGYQQDKGK